MSQHLLYPVGIGHGREIELCAIEDAQFLPALEGRSVPGAMWGASQALFLSLLTKSQEGESSSPLLDT